MENTDFTNIYYLRRGNEIQQKTFRILTEINILDILSAYKPIVVGTIPINIDIENSDVDIILEATNFIELQKLILTHFSTFNDFEIIHQQENEILICNFTIEDLPFEIYASSIPTVKQNGYLHMVKEHELLQHFGEDFRNEIIGLKQAGYKTEPAFCKALNIEGDPYIELLNFIVKI